MELVALVILALAVALVFTAASGIVSIARTDPRAFGTLAEDDDATELGNLAERKEMVMQLMLSTQLDRQTDKISDDDFDKTMARLKREAVAVMKRMDELGGEVDDIERANEELAGFVAQAKSAEVDGQWSPAARVRHGGARAGEGVERAEADA